MTLAATLDRDAELAQIKNKFLSLTGLHDVETKLEAAGPELFVEVFVGRDAPIYRTAISVINSELPSESSFRGRLVLKALNERFRLRSAESGLIRSLITQSLRVTSDKAGAALVVEFAPFRGGEEQTIAETANHAILGRRGVGKSSLILLGFRRLVSTGQVPVWVDLQPYRGARKPHSVMEIIREVFTAAYSQFADNAFADAKSICSNALQQSNLTEHTLQTYLPRLRECVRTFVQKTGRRVHVFLDDVHLVSDYLQPFLFDSVYSVLKGVGGFLNVAGVKNLTRLYDAGRKFGLQVPHDVQPVDLDLTLTDPSAARSHLINILNRFLKACGLKTHRTIVSGSAVERLVWCSAGVPRDFLWLFQAALQTAGQNRRSRVGVQEVNLAVGEFAQQKLQDLAADTTDASAQLQEFLEELQSACLDRLRSNSFLAKPAPGNQGYDQLRKLMDLRLVHLLHPSVNTGRAGERYEAYLLDYSFYTGIRRRQRISELKISGEAPPRYTELRRLPKLDVEALAEHQA